MDERQAGHSLVESLVVLGMIGVLSAVAIPRVRAYTVEANVLAAGRAFKGEFLRARSIAAKKSLYTAIRFEVGPVGAVTYSTYVDGNRNGVTSQDIRAGVDVRIAGPLPLNAGAPEVEPGFLARVPAIPPESGFLGGDAIRFGPSDTVSFSPLGTATPGTLYLRGEGVQGAVRVTGGSARVRLMVWRGRGWSERS
jgi:type II secretory pathway pseudopilin PulG